MTRLRVAILGQGRSGRDIHGLYLLKQPRKWRIVAAADPIKVRRERAKEEYGCDVYSSWEPILERNDLDLVINSLPSHLHAPVSLKYLKAGFNLLCEKPLAGTAKEVDQLIAAAKKGKRIFAIYQQSRYAPYFHQVRKVIASGALGRIVQVSIAFSGFSRRWDWQTLTDFQGGNLMNTGPHPLDQALRILDYPTNKVPEVFCCMDRAHFWGDAEGHVNMVLRAPGRPIIHLEISSCNAYPCFMYNVYGTQGGMKGNAAELEWRYYKPAEAPKHGAARKPVASPDGYPTYCREDLKWYTGKWTVPKSKSNLFGTMGHAFYSGLYKHITTGAPLEITPDQVRQQIAVIEEAHRQNPHIWGSKKKRKK